MANEEPFQAPSSERLPVGAADQHYTSELAIEAQAPEAATDQRVWIFRQHHRVTLRQAHAVVEVDWDAGVARTSCKLALGPQEITDVPAGGCMPCVACIAATPLPGDAPDG